MMSSAYMDGYREGLGERNKQVLEKIFEFRSVFRGDINDFEFSKDKLELCEIFIDEFMKVPE